MLRALTIENVVLIKHLDLVFERGLSAFTGETGAGKSILLDALGLALGERGESRLVRKGQPQAVVTAAFEITASHPCSHVLQEHGIRQSADELLLRRVLTAEGRSRAFINDQPVSISLLNFVGEQLVEIHGQFDRLLEPRYHRQFLDTYAGLEAPLKQTKLLYEDWSNANAALEAAKKLASEKQVNEAFLRHVLEELKNVEPKPGEETDLTERRIRIANAAKITNIAEELTGLIEGENGARNQLNRALRLCEKGVSLVEPSFGEVSKALTTASCEAEEASALLRKLIQDCKGDAKSLDDIENRLAALRSLARKHRCTTDDLAKIQERIEKDLDLIDNSDIRLNELEKTVEKAKHAYLQQAKALSQSRKEAAARLDVIVLDEFSPLKLNNAEFITQVVELPETQWGPEGIDQVKFLVATNKGSAFGDLKTIASGGERSRFMLALKVVLSRLMSTPTLIFDEIDTGIGGATARAVGERLARLSQSIQVLAITHSPQVASIAAHHWRVEKITQLESTETSVVLLTDLERREEIARMLAGENITDEARAAAEKLLCVG